MNLAQLRDFSSAFYGTGTAFELGSKYLLDALNTSNKLVAIYDQFLEKQEKEDFRSQKNTQNSLIKLIKTFNLDIDSALVLLIF